MKHLTCLQFAQSLELIFLKARMKAPLDLRIDLGIGIGGLQARLVKKGNAR
jgi:hypothetical protein